VSEFRGGYTLNIIGNGREILIQKIEKRNPKNGPSYAMRPPRKLGRGAKDALRRVNEGTSACWHEAKTENRKTKIGQEQVAGWLLIPDREREGTKRVVRSVAWLVS